MPIPVAPSSRSQFPPANGVPEAAAQVHAKTSFSASLSLPHSLVSIRFSISSETLRICLVGSILSSGSTTHVRHAPITTVGMEELMKVPVDNVALESISKDWRVGSGENRGGQGSSAAISSLPHD
eukprot:scaffold14414_cov114-Isochrysis_galbana.AAC.2